MNYCLSFFAIILLLTTTSCKKQQHLAVLPEERDSVAQQALDPSISPPTPKKENFLIPLEEVDGEETQQEADVELPSIDPAPGEETVDEIKPVAKKIEKLNNQKNKNPENENGKSLDFEVENKTGRTLYITCFSYIKKRHYGRWRWDKSAIYQLEPGATTLVDIDFIPDEQNRKSIFGYLGVFDTQDEAEDATFELTKDEQKLDLDKLDQLKDKKVTIEVERYGFKGEFLEYDFVKKKKSEADMKPELDVLIENKTGKTIHVVGFIYQKKAKGSWFGAIDEKDDMAVWRFDKTPILTLKANEEGYIDVDTLLQDRDRLYIRGYLTVFDENEIDLAEKATYELTESWRKLHLDRLIQLHNKKIVINIEQYGINEDFIDYVIKEAKSPFDKTGTNNENSK